MRKFIGYLFPWRQTYRHLELEKRWWHRLVVVLFFVALVPTFLCSWVIGDDANPPQNAFGDNIHHWGTLPGTPNGVLLDLDSQPLDNTSQAVSAPPILQKTIEMPDGKTATFPGSISDEAIKSEWQNELSTDQTWAIFYGLGIALLVTVCFSYLLQAGYRAVLFVIYGAKARILPDGSPLDEAGE